MKSFKEIFLSYAKLDANGKHCGGTDKATNHNYGEAYDIIFPDRSKVKLLLEVGITDGSSMLAFREAFETALIVGMDVVPCSCERGPRLEFHIGDQRSKSDCNAAASGRQFDAIIEDAFHSLDNTLMTLFWLWPFVKHGGVYIVEEWYNIGSDLHNVMALFPNAMIVDTDGPFGGVESLVVLQKNGYY